MDLKPGISAWYGVKMPCTSFHVCESFGVVPMSHMWDDCDEPDCSMCESECSQVPEYEWFGSYWAMDPPMERCMMYKPGKTFVITTPFHHIKPQCSVVQFLSIRCFNM